MKTNFFNYLALGAIALTVSFSACHSGAKDSTEAADSANKKQITATDSANKANTAAADSANKARKELKEDASKFLVKSFESGMFEIQLSQLAATNGLNADVKNLSAQLVGAHTAINAKISTIAADANFVLPSALTADHQKQLEDMVKLTGASFDKKYISTIVSGHEKSVDGYKDAYKNLASSPTRTFAGETLPKIEDHLAMAQKVKDRIK